MAEDIQKTTTHEQEEYSLVFMILSDFRMQNRRLSRFAVMVLVGWLLTIFVFVGYILADRWYDSQESKEVTLYQTQNLDQNDNIGENQNITMSLEQGEPDGIKKDSVSTN